MSSYYSNRKVKNKQNKWTSKSCVSFESYLLWLRRTLYLYMQAFLHPLPYVYTINDGGLLKQFSITEFATKEYRIYSKYPDSKSNQLIFYWVEKYKIYFPAHHREWWKQEKYITDYKIYTQPASTTTRAIWLVIFRALARFLLDWLFGILQEWNGAVCDAYRHSGHVPDTRRGGKPGWNCLPNCLLYYQTKISHMEKIWACT